MCGIVSIFAYEQDAPPVKREELLRIRDRMTLRGPDGCGEWYSADMRVGLGHRRLAIIDLSATGAQPMANGDGSLVVTFNGEIYNYRELRSGLEQQGYRFRSTSDTEVLLHLYAAKGPEMVHDLRGMFAFAIWDQRERSLFMARDPLGIKPLYLADNGRTLRAASQVKALLAGGEIDTTPEPAGHVGFFLWGHVPEPYTFYKGIRALPAGTWLRIGADGRKSSARFCSVADLFSEAGRNPDGPGSREVLREALVDSVKRHLVADVPVGIFLSSGLDSSTLLALAAESKGDIRTVTLGFREYRGTADDEVPLAEMLSARYGADHRTVWVEREDFEKEYAGLLAAMDQPTIDGVNSYFVSMAAARSGLKVAISGLGGDELFGGYPGFSQIPRMTACFGMAGKVPLLGRAFRIVSAPIMKKFTSPKYAGLLEYGGEYGGAYLLRRGMFMPWELPDILDGEMVREGWRELRPLSRLADSIAGVGASRLKVSALELGWYMRNQLLRDTDWAAMAHSLEVRVPFVDVELIRRIAPMIAGQSPPGKREMAATPTRPLPAEVLERRKTGFSVPTREWLVGGADAPVERGLRGWTKHIYAEFSLGGREAVKPSAVSVVAPPGTRDRRILVLATDAFGGHGGIALYNRDLLTALCSRPDCAEVVAIPRLMLRAPEPYPDKLTYVTTGIDCKLKYLETVVREAAAVGKFDLIVCAHINLLAAACLLRSFMGVPVILAIYGIDAWQPTRSQIVNTLAGRIDACISISDLTMKRFVKWSGLAPHKQFLLPNAIHTEFYGPGGKDTVLLDRYGLGGKTAILTLGRLVDKERYKGFDEVMELLPDLAREIPDIAYLIIGDGSDRGRLEKKAKQMGLADRVVFAGYIPESAKPAHYRLADAYVMPSRGEGFGFVFLEAMACGIPVVGSTLDGSREALRDGELGILVDPDNTEDVREGILAALRSRKGEVPEGLDYFSYPHFARRLNGIVDTVLETWMTGK